VCVVAWKQTSSESLLVRLSAMISLNMPLLVMSFRNCLKAYHLRCVGKEDDFSDQFTCGERLCSILSSFSTMHDCCGNQHYTGALVMLRAHVQLLIPLYILDHILHL
jgi:hypothetical protein